MGLGSKLNFAFVTVILVTAAIHILIATGFEYTHIQGRLAAANKALFQEIQQIDKSNTDVCNYLINDGALMVGISSQNRDQIAEACKDFVNKTGFTGFLAFCDRNGNLIYSTETPAKFGMSMKDNNPGLQSAMSGQPYHGYAMLSPAGTLSVACIVPTQAGLISANQPLNSETLTGIAGTFAFRKDIQAVPGIEMLVFSFMQKKVLSASAELIKQNNKLINELNKNGDRAFPNTLFPVENNFWQMMPLPTVPNGKSAYGVLIFGTSASTLFTEVQHAFIQDAICAVIAFALAMVFSSKILAYVNDSLDFLIKRVQDISKQKAKLEPLDHLDGLFFDLGETIDSSVSSMRSSISSLKSQVAKHGSEIQEKTKQIETVTGQLNQLSNSMSGQTGQIVDYNKQINLVNQQATVISQRLNSVLQVSGEGYLLLDPYGKIISANPTFLSWTDSNENDVIGLVCFDVINRPDEPAGRKQPSSKHGLQPDQLIAQFFPEGVIYSLDGQKRTEVLAHLQPIVTDESNLHGYVMVLRDKSLRAELAHLRTEIVAILNESIRGPLITAEPYWDQLLKQSAGSLPPNVGQSLAQLHSHYQQLLAVTDSLLMMYGGFTPPPAEPKEQIILTKLVSECMEEIADSARARKINLDYKTVTSLPALNSNRQAIKESLVHLLQHMMGKSNEGSRVRVETIVSNGLVRIGVSSNTAQMSDDDITDMFAGFIEGKHKEETYPEKLSLFLVRSNVERLGGVIWPERMADGGVVAYFTLPIA